MKQFFHETFNKRTQQFKKLRDCFEGQDAIREAGTEYLPKPGGMPDTTEGSTMYASYKGRAMYYSVLERTLRSLLGIVFRVPPMVDVPDKIKQTTDALTSEGDSLDESVRTAVLEALHMGRHGIMLELPVGERTDAQPYIAHYNAEDITDWREDVIDGRKQLTMVMLRDALREGDERGTERFRELVLVDDVYMQRCWCAKKVDGKAADAVCEEEITPLIRGQAIAYIPFWFIGPYSNKPRLEKSPMLDLANESLNHYQIGADWRQALHMLAQPTPYIASDTLFSDDKLTPNLIGASTFWVIPSDARPGMLEYSGAGTRDLHDALIKSENTMAALGAKLVHRGRQPETAEATRVKARDEISVVESTVMSVEDAYQSVLTTMADWMGIAQPVTFGMDRDFIEEKVDASMLATLIKACFEDKALSRNVYHLNLQRGGIMPTSRTVDDEIEDGADGAVTPAPAVDGEGNEGGQSDDDTDDDRPDIPPASGEEIQKLALNGAQITALQGIVRDVSLGELPFETAVALIEEGFPQITHDKVLRILQPARNFTPKSATVAGEGAD